MREVAPPKAVTKGVSNKKKIPDGIRESGVSKGCAGSKTVGPSFRLRRNDRPGRIVPAAQSAPGGFANPPTTKENPEWQKPFRIFL